SHSSAVHFVSDASPPPRTLHSFPTRRSSDLSEMVSRQRTEFRLRHQSHDYPRGIMACAELAHVGSLCVQLLAFPALDLCRFRLALRGRRAYLLGNGSLRREKIRAGTRRFDRQSSIQRYL